VIGWHPGFVGWAMIIASPFVGSFLGVAITRVPAGQQIVWDRSRCDHCGAPLAAFDLVPVLSWTILRGRCRHCGRRLSLLYPLIELAAIAVALMSAVFASGPWIAIATLGGWLLLTTAGIAWRRRRQ
jgi:leader peptidase (prepilin peptidase)/N-methyltransferase